MQFILNLIWSILGCGNDLVIAADFKIDIHILEVLIIGINFNIKRIGICSAR